MCGADGPFISMSVHMLAGSTRAQCRGHRGPLKASNERAPEWDSAPGLSQNQQDLCKEKGSVGRAQVASKGD